MINKTPLEEWIKEKINPLANGLTREEIEAYQMNAFIKTIEYVKLKSRFYKALLNEHHVSDIRSLEDIKKLPFTTPMDIISQGNRMICVKQSEIHRIVTLNTSGTTGISKRLFFTKEDQELTKDFFNFGMSTFTKAKDKVLVLLPGKSPGSIGDLLKIGLNRMGVDVIVYGVVDDPKKVLDLIIKEKITGIVGIPQQIYRLTQLKRSKEIKLIGLLKNVLLSTDYVSPMIIEKIKNNWGCKVYEHYGMTEMGLGGGVFCEALKGYHLREADLYFEIIDPKTKEVLPDGEFGEVVFTTLTRRGMPLIRYRTGDISRFIVESCSCGTILKTLDRINPRWESSIKTKRGVVLTMPFFEDLLFSIPGIVDFEIEISYPKKQSDQYKECLTIYIQTEDALQEIEKNSRKKLMDSFLEKSIKSNELEIKIILLENKEVDIKAMQKRKIRDNR